MKRNLLFNVVVGALVVWWAAMYLDLFGVASRLNGAPHPDMRHMIESNLLAWCSSLAVLWLGPAIVRHERLPGVLMRLAGLFMSTWFLAPKGWDISMLGGSILLFLTAWTLESRTRPQPPS